MAKINRGDLSLRPGNNGIAVFHGSQWIGHLVEVNGGTAMVAVPCKNFEKATRPLDAYTLEPMPREASDELRGNAVYDPREGDTATASRVSELTARVSSTESTIATTSSLRPASRTLTPQSPPPPPPSLC